MAEMARRPAVLALLAAGLALAAAVVVRVGAGATWEVLRGVRPLAWAAAAILTGVAYALRGARSRAWERRLGLADALGLVLIGFMGNNLLPARRGELLRARCTASRTKADETAALASIAAERTLDALAIALLGLAGAALAPLDPWARLALAAASLAVATPAAVLVYGVFSDARGRRLDAFHARFPGHLTRYARDRVVHFLESLQPLRDGRVLARAALVTAAIWAAELAAYGFFARAVGIPLDAPAVLAFVAAVNLASLFPLPGGLGVIELVATAVLARGGVAAPAALAMVLLQHGTQYALVTAGGWVLYLGGRFRGISLVARGAPRASAADAAPAAILAGTQEHLAALAAAEALEAPAPRVVALSIVIPAYNEQARLPRTLLETLRWCAREKVNAEVLVVDDGSRDGTLALGRLFEEQDRRVRVLACPHAGKGAAVRMGMLNARGRRVLFMDADGATPLDQIPKLVTAIDAGRDVAIGSRVAQRPGEARLETSLHRKLIGRTFAFLVNLLAVPGIGDTQCGFKMFRAEVVRAIFGRQRMDGFAFDVEVLYLAHRLGLSVEEIPVDWAAQPGSKVNLVTDSIRMLRDVARVRWMHRQVE
jgi:dolichyl-phosphate beta-glucosyltransferase